MLHRLAWGALGGWIWLLAELLLALGRHGDRIASSWEFLTGIGSLVPPLLLLGTLPGSLGGGLAGALDRWSERSQFGRARIVLGLSALLFGAAVGYGVGGGRHLATPVLRLGFAAVVGLGGACGGALSAGALLMAVRGEASRLRLQIAAGSVALACAFVNQWVLVRLYPAFHLGLSVLSLVLAGFAAALGARSGRTSFPVLAGLGLSLAALSPASHQLSGMDNFRSVMQESSPSLGHAVRLASQVAPPEELDASVLALPLGSRTHTDHTFRIHGWNIVLITVDALRADHLGAYGYERPVSPNIDALAKSGVVFDAAYAPTPHTSYSVTSLMTGKYMRPLLLQGAGEDSDLWAKFLQNYGYRTAAFYPPAIFFVGREKFSAFEKGKLGFEYAWVEFAEGEKRIRQVEEYLRGVPGEQRLFTWVHLFGPHEPYEPGPQSFGERDVDRYDSEIHAADATIGRLIELFRAREPKTLFIVTADHGEEFGEHGGRYHGTTVYEEQIRVPLIIAAPGLTTPHRVAAPVQTIDLFPTVAGALEAPIPPRTRGTDLGTLLQKAEPSEGFAAAETETMTLLARGQDRLICDRETGACRLFDLSKDPHQTTDTGAARPERFQELKKQSRAWVASHGVYETRGLRAEGQGYPEAILRAIAGDADTAPELARLLEDADPAIRRKAAELLFNVGTSAERGALRLAFSREDDPVTRTHLGIALSRLGEVAPVTLEALDSQDAYLRRRAALALAEQGQPDGAKILLEWWHARPSEEDSLAILKGLERLRPKGVIDALVARLGEVRLRAEIARVLGALGDKDALIPLLTALQTERFVSAREPLLLAAKKLGAKKDLIGPLVTYLGMPEPTPHGVELARELGIMAELGGPKLRDVRSLAELGDSAVQLAVQVPGIGRAAEEQGVRLVILAENSGDAAGEVRVEVRRPSYQKKSAFRQRPGMSPDGGLSATVPPHTKAQFDLGLLPDVHPGQAISLLVWASGGTKVLGFAAVPRRSEFPPPPPEPWKATGTAP